MQNFCLTDRIILSSRDGVCLALHLEKGLVYEFELPFFEWLENLVLPRTASSILQSLPFAKEESSAFLKTLINEGLLIETAKGAQNEMPPMDPSIKLLSFMKAPFQKSPDREWQREVVFATSVAIST